MTIMLEISRIKTAVSFIIMLISEIGIVKGQSGSGCYRLQDHLDNSIGDSNNKTEVVIKSLRKFEGFCNPWNLGPPVRWTSEDLGWSETDRENFVGLMSRYVNQIKHLPNFTKTGFKKMKIPKSLLRAIINEKTEDIVEREAPESDEDAHFCLLMNCIQPSSQLVGFRDIKHIRKGLEFTLKPIIEKWSGTSVKSDAVIYGIRRYLKGAELGVHVDRYPSHILSVILQIDQKVTEQWPLLMLDMEGHQHEIYLKPGEMLLYEGAKLPHGRPLPFNGTYFDNLFIHFTPFHHLQDG